MPSSPGVVHDHREPFIFENMLNPSSFGRDSFSEPGPDRGGTTMCPQDLICSCFLSSMSEFLPFHDIAILPGSTIFTLHGEEPWLNEDIVPSLDSRLSPVARLSYLRTVRAHLRQRKNLYFCGVKHCLRASRTGFSSRRLRDRHQAKHKSRIACEWEGCIRLFDDVENMNIHLEQIHRRQHPVQGNV